MGHEIRFKNKCDVSSLYKFLMPSNPELRRENKTRRNSRVRNVPLYRVYQNCVIWSASRGWDVLKFLYEDIFEVVWIMQERSNRGRGLNILPVYFYRNSVRLKCHSFHNCFTRFNPEGFSPISLTSRASFHHLFSPALWVNFFLSQPQFPLTIFAHLNTHFNQLIVFGGLMQLSFKLPIPSRSVKWSVSQENVSLN